jgi:lysophospholipid acyltransferase (LPLAT)-like uncharacterized protein
VTIAFHSLITVLCSTVRWTVSGWSSYDDVRGAGERFIATLWHDRLVLATWFWRRRGIVVMTSRSFDGEYIARFIQRFGYGAARGSSTRGGAEALDEMATCLGYGIDAALTIDDADATTIAEARDRLQASLDALRERADGWWSRSAA